MTLDATRLEVARIVGRGTGAVRGGVPFTPRAKKALELALHESRSLGHDYIGTEHLLLGLIDENQGVGARILRDRGVGVERIRSEVMKMLSGRRQE